MVNLFEDANLYAIHWKRVTLSQKKRQRFEPGTVAIREIRKHQKSVDLLIPHAPFLRLVEEITHQLSMEVTGWAAKALISLQEAAEFFMVNLFEDANLRAIHAKRVILSLGQSPSSRFGTPSMFGQANNLDTNPFASKSFGTPSPFGSQTGSSIFGTSTGVFGQPSGAPAFNASSLLAFGASSSSPFSTATPKQIKELMNVDRLTNDEVNNHLQRHDDSVSSTETSPNPSEKRQMRPPKTTGVSDLKSPRNRDFAGRREKKWWNQDEEDALRKGVERFGKGKWALIKNSYTAIFEDRTTVDLKDKWRNMTK